MFKRILQLVVFATFMLVVPQALAQSSLYDEEYRATVIDELKSRLNVNVLPAPIDVTTFTRILLGESAESGLQEAELYKDSSNVYCYSPKNKSISKVLGADIKTFNVTQDIQTHFIADKNFIYEFKLANDCSMKKIKVKAGLVQKSSNIFIDTKFVYYFSRGKFILVKGSDSKTFVKAQGHYGILRDSVFKDKNNVYFCRLKVCEIKKLNIDASTFEFAKETSEVSSFESLVIFKDKNSVYVATALFLDEFGSFPQVDVQSFVITSLSPVLRAKDKNALYVVNNGKITRYTNVDIASYEDIFIPESDARSLSNVSHFSKDKNYVYDTITMKKLEGADPQTFQLHARLAVPFRYEDEFNYFIYATDKNHFWYVTNLGAKLVKDINPKDITFYSGARFYRGNQLISWGLLLKSNNRLWKFYDKEKLEPIAAIDAPTFTQLYRDIYMDKNGVYCNGDFKKIIGMVAQKAEVKIFKGKLYIKDIKNVFVSEKECIFTKIPNANPDNFFNLKKSSPNEKILSLTAVDTWKLSGEEDSLYLDLESGKLSGYLDNANEDYKIQYYWPKEVDLLLNMSDFSISTINGVAVMPVDKTFENTKKSSIPSFFEENNLSSMIVKKGVVFIVKTNLGKFYKVEIMDLNDQGNEIVLRYAVLK